MNKYIKNILLTAFTAMLCAGCISNKAVKREYNKDTTMTVIIGLEESKRYGKCVGSEIDVEKMSKLLEPYSAKQTVLFNWKATRERVTEALKEACQQDLAIIYYSGHGGSQQQMNPVASDFVEPSGYDSFLCLYDYPLLDDNIWEIVSNAKGRVVLIFDCCHSATMFRDAPSFLTFGQEQRLLAAGDGSKEPQILVLAGCPDEKFSYGSQFGGEMTQKFRKYFDKDKTYNDVFKAIVNDPQLKKVQQPSMTVVGKSFVDVKIFN